ncbi:T9SS type A sorting domain-containing protein, partial [Kaistella sp.]|uniref:T9SS type A sorting domain-containing protein n=1 Tax=Kaistella sp. TaxID=2782235 RepID=UPI002F932845
LFVSDIFTSPLATQNIRTNLGDRSIVVYPNPASNEVTIKIPGGDKIVSVEFLDATGRTVTNSNKEMINIEKLPTGIYIIKVLTKDKIYSGKVIKK